MIPHDPSKLPPFVAIFHVEASTSRGVKGANLFIFARLDPFVGRCCRFFRVQMAAVDQTLPHSFSLRPIDLRGGNCSKKATTKKLAMHFRDNEIGKRIQRGPRFLAHVSKASPFVPPLNQHTDCPGVALKDYSAGASLGPGRKFGSA